MYYFTDKNEIEESLDIVNTGTGADTATRNYTHFGAFVDEAIQVASAIIMNETKRQFVPEYKTLSIYHRNLDRPNNLREWWDWADYVLHIGEDIGELDQIDWLGTTLSSSAYRKYPSTTRSAKAVEFDYDVATIEFDSSTFSNSTDIIGFFFYHSDLANAWDTIDNSVTINSSSTTLSLNTGHGVEVFQYVRLEDEIMLVTAVTANGGTDDLTVVRGSLGTTAAAHTAVSVTRFKVQPDIKKAATRLVTWMYQSRGLVGNVAEVIDGTVIIDAMPTVVKSVLNKYKQSGGV